MDISTLKVVVGDAVRRIILEQWELQEYDAGERTVTSHLFRYMCDHDAVPGHIRVDHEYNRHEGATKTIRSLISSEAVDEGGERRIYPDVVVHRRGDDEENWLALEAKRANASDDLDRMKIIALIEEYGYRWGVLLSLGTGDGLWNPQWEWIGSDGSNGIEPLFSPDEVDELNRLGRADWERRRRIQISPGSQLTYPGRSESGSSAVS